MVKLLCAIAGVEGSVFPVEIDEEKLVGELKEMIKTKHSPTFTRDARELTLYLTKKDMDDKVWLLTKNQVEVGDVGIDDFMLLHAGAKLLYSGLSASEVALTVEEIEKTNEDGGGPVNILVELPKEALEHLRWNRLLPTLKWKEPNQLCSSSGCKWPYQGAPKLIKKIEKPLVEHYDAWRKGLRDKQNHALNLVVSGPGAGKSRMLDEMKGLLIRAAERSKDQTLIKRVKNAYVFKVTFETDSTTGTLLNHDYAEFHISYRMLYQFSTEGEQWSSFAAKVEKTCRGQLWIESVMDILADLEKVDKVEDMTVILCVDDLQQLGHDGTQRCEFYRVLRSVCGFLNTCRAFAVCVCSSTVEVPVEVALSISPQYRRYLVPPALNGHEILSTDTSFKEQLVEDMGGHGRALEILEKVWQRHTNPLESTDPERIIEMVNQELQLEYGDLFNSPLLDPITCQNVLAAILSQRRYEVTDRIGDTSLRVDTLRSLGLFRFNRERPLGCVLFIGDGRLECAFIFLVELLRRSSNLTGELGGFDEYITRSVWKRQRFEHFVGFYRWVKSIVYRNTPVSLSSLHTGARFGETGVVVTEPKSRQLLEAEHLYDTQSVAGDSLSASTRAGAVGVSDTSKNAIAVSDTSDFSTGSLSMGVELRVASKQVQCNEVIRCKMLQTKKRLRKVDYAKERAKAVGKSLDVFLLITSGEVDEFELPPRCGLVSITEFPQYFGPFASRARRRILVRGLYDRTRDNAVEKKTKRRFGDIEGPTIELFERKRSKTAGGIGS